MVTPTEQWCVTAPSQSPPKSSAAVAVHDFVARKRRHCRRRNRPGAGMPDGRATGTTLLPYTAWQRARARHKVPGPVRWRTYLARATTPVPTQTQCGRPPPCRTTYHCVLAGTRRQPACAPCRLGWDGGLRRQRRCTQLLGGSNDMHRIQTEGREQAARLQLIQPDQQGAQAGGRREPASTRRQTVRLAGD